MKTAFLLLMLGMSAWGQESWTVAKPWMDGDVCVVSNGICYVLDHDSTRQVLFHKPAFQFSTKRLKVSGMTPLEKSVADKLGMGGEPHIASTSAVDSAKPEPMDVPAVKVGTELGWNCDEKSHACTDGMVDKFECADKERIGPFWSKDGKSHCLKFPKERP